MTLLARLRAAAGASAIVALLGFAGAQPAAAEVPVPALSARVTDLTATLSEGQKAGLESELARVEQAGGGQMAVLIVPTTQPESIEQFSMRVVERWRLGRKGKDDGLLLLVAKNDRKIRIEVGFGLEGAVTDALARRVIDETIAPRFKAGDFAGGLSAGVSRLAEAIAGAPAAVPAAEVPPRADSVAEPLLLDLVRDMTDTLDPDLTWRMSRRLHDFYNSGRTKPVHILIVPSTGSEAIADYTRRVFQRWGEVEQLDIDRSLLLVIAADVRRAHAEAGDGLRVKLPAGALEALVAEAVAPPLAQGDVAGALEAAVPAIERNIDAAIANKTVGERVAESAQEWTLPALAIVVVIGSILRWVIGPFLAGLTMGGVIGGSVWLLSGELQVAVIAGVVAFVFFLVGVLNWLSIVASGGGGGRSGGGGGFSGGGGSFGGGGASGSW